MQQISYEHFASVHICAGTVIRAELFPKAKKPAYKIWVDFGGDLGVKQTSAQVTAHYTPESLVGKKIMGCVNLGVKNVAGFISEFLILGFSDISGAIMLPELDERIPNGSKLH